MQRYFVESKENNYLILNKEDLHHIKNVMRNKVGDHIETVFNEKLYISEIESLNDRKVKTVHISFLHEALLNDNIHVKYYKNDENTNYYVGSINDEVCFELVVEVY